jgi:hypothetical protein
MRTGSDAAEKLAVENNQYKKKENVSRDNPLDKPCSRCSTLPIENHHVPLMYINDKVVTTGIMYKRDVAKNNSTLLK